MRHKHTAPSFLHLSVNGRGGWTRARPPGPSGGPVSDADAGRTKHQAGPTILSLSHSLGFLNRRTHRHLPRAAAGELAPSFTKSSLV